MAKPVASVLGSQYWSVVPFRLGPDHVVKVQLTPAVEEPPLTQTPGDRNYLGTDLAARLNAGDMRFRDSGCRFSPIPRRCPSTMRRCGWDEAQ